MYICTQKILAWIMYEKRGLTPMEFGLSSLFPAQRPACPPVSSRGSPSCIDAGTIQNTETDLHMTPRHLAKLVLLFRQQGLAAPDGPRLLSTTFVQTANAFSAVLGGSKAPASPTRMHKVGKKRGRKKARNGGKKKGPV